MRKTTVICELLHRLPVAYGGEVEQLRAREVIKLLEKELDALVEAERKQILQAFEDGRRLGDVCTSEAYYTLKYERR